MVKKSIALPGERTKAGSMSGRPTYGIVEGETPPVRHRLSTIADRSCCGKRIVIPTGNEKSKLVVCRRCIAIDTTRREGLPDWF
jgi:hypothetical protein